jgi:hypothetical protein
MSMMLALAAASGTAAAQSEAVPPGQWVIDYGQMACTLMRRADGERAPLIAINSRLGLVPGELLVIDGGDGVDRRLSGPLRVTAGDGPAAEVLARRETRAGRALAAIRPMPDDFLDRLAAASRLTIADASGTIVAAALPDAGAAVAALAACNDDLLVGWGVDLVARRALATQPELTDHGWLMDIAPHGLSSLVFVADISRRGGPTGCRVVASSGDARFDRQFCRALQRRARFRPAQDAAGAPVESQMVSRVTWHVG